MEDLSRRLLQESDEYAEVLLWNNEYDHSDDDDSFSDHSSGYESTGIHSDLYSCSSEESHDNIYQPVINKTESEVMRFQSIQPLCENLKLILSMPEMCDVKFLVGPDQVPIHGVRAILGTRSRRFYELILKHISMGKEDSKLNKKKSTKKELSSSLFDKLVIPVKKYDPEVFRNLIQFVHCGSVNVTDETAAGLYCGACQFELRDLEKACLDFIERRVQSGNYVTLLKSTRNYSQHSATKLLFDKIYEATDRHYKKYGETLV